MIYSLKSFVNRMHIFLFVVIR